MTFPRTSKLFLGLFVVAALGSSLYAQSAHALMPAAAPGTYRSHARTAGVPAPLTTHAPGANCGAISPQVPCYYGPADVYSFYNVGFIANGNGGAGITVAIVDAYYDPTVCSNRSAFLSYYGYSATGTLSIVNETGTAIPCGTPAGTDGAPSDGGPSGWSVEINLDVQAVTAMAPAANILLVNCNSSSFSDLGAGVLYAQAHANVVTDSWGAPEFSGESSLDTYFSASTVPILFSSGDSGGPDTEYPCASTYVFCVGGTKVITNVSDFRTLETTWGGSDTNGGSSGGCSSQISQPAWQVGFTNSVCDVSGPVGIAIVPNTPADARGMPDIAALADPYTGLQIYLSSDACDCGVSGVQTWGGTSLASPLMAGLIANIDAARVAASKSKLGSGLSSQAYGAAGGAFYHFRYYDVTTGISSCPSCGTSGFSAVAGWDRATGLGVLLGPAFAAYLVSLP